MSKISTFNKKEEEAISNSEIYSQKSEKEDKEEEKVEKEKEEETKKEEKKDKEEIKEEEKKEETKKEEENSGIKPENESNENIEKVEKNENNENLEISDENNNNVESKSNMENDEIEIEVMDRGMNTDELSERELNRLINENKELLDENNNDKSICHVEHDTKTDITPNKKALMEELTKNDEVYDVLLQSNNELNAKIQMSLKKYQDIIDKIEEKKSENIERKLTLKIKELEKEIKANNSETERYKKLIEQLKDKIEFQENIERSSNLQKFIKQETLKNKELKNRLNTLIKINKYQTKYMENYDKKHKTQEKMEQLKSEIQQNRDYIKEYSNKYLKLDRFTKIAHEKILSLKMYVKKIIQEPKIEEKKIFTNEETKDTLGIITNLKTQIIEKRKELNEIQKKSEIKIHELLVKNKQIEIEFIENEKINKNLIFRKNELNKQLKQINDKNKNKNVAPVIQKINLQPIIDENVKKFNKKNEEKSGSENKTSKIRKTSKEKEGSSNRTKDDRSDGQSEDKKSTKRKKKKKKEKVKEEVKKEEEKVKEEDKKEEEKVKEEDKKEEKKEEKPQEENKKEEIKEEKKEEKKEVKKEEKKEVKKEEKTEDKKAKNKKKKVKK